MVSRSFPSDCRRMHGRAGSAETPQTIGTGGELVLAGHASLAATHLFRSAHVRPDELYGRSPMRVRGSRFRTAEKGPKADRRAETSPSKSPLSKAASTAVRD